jgi:hypothetical protein
MSPIPFLLLGLLAVREEPEADELVRRGYELLPNARWLEELQRDRSGSFLGVPTPTLSSSTPATGPLVVEFERFDYDPRGLYEEELPFARDPNEQSGRRLSKREKWIWELATMGMYALAPNRPWDGWIPPVKPLHSAK